MTAAPAPVPMRPASAPGSTLLLLLKLRTFVALILVFGFFAFAAPNFLSTANLVIMSKHVALNAPPQGRPCRAQFDHHSSPCLPLSIQAIDSNFSTDAFPNHFCH